MSGFPILVTRPDGSVGLVDERGKPIPGKQRIVITAGDMERALIQLAQTAIAVGRQLGAEDMQKVAAQTIPQLMRATSVAYAKAGAEAGVKVGARYVMEHSTLRRKVERDAKGRITGTIEERVPISPTSDKRPIGFRK
jgi:hypothetical protein